MICFVIYGVNIYVSKHKIYSFEKNVWYSNDFCWNFPWFWLIEADPDLADQNETDPNGSGSENTDPITHSFSPSLIHSLTNLLNIYSSMTFGCIVYCLIHSLTYSLTHSVTHSLTYYLLLHCFCLPSSLFTHGHTLALTPSHSKYKYWLSRSKSTRYKGTVSTLNESRSTRYTGIISTLSSSRSTRYTGNISTVSNSRSTRYTGTISTLYSSRSTRYTGNISTAS